MPQIIYSYNKHDITLSRAKEILENTPPSHFPVKWGIETECYFRQVGYQIDQYIEDRKQWFQVETDAAWIDLQTLQLLVDAQENIDSDAESQPVE